MLVTFEAITFLDIAKIALKRNISRRFLAGEEGFEPSAYGFGDASPTVSISLILLAILDIKKR